MEDRIANLTEIDSEIIARESLINHMTNSMTPIEEYGDDVKELYQTKHMFEDLRDFLLKSQTEGGRKLFTKNEKKWFSRFVSFILWLRKFK